MQYEIGSAVTHKKHGDGVVKRIDPESRDFAYLCSFADKSLAWVAEKNLKPVQED